jgi:hypothetical protein
MAAVEEEEEEARAAEVAERERRGAWKAESSWAWGSMMAWRAW